MSESCNDCPLEPRVKALEDAAKTHHETHEKIFDKLGKIETKNATQDAYYEAIKSRLDELAIMVGNLSSKSGKRWDSFGDKILWFIIEAVLIVAAVKIGLS